MLLKLFFYLEISIFGSMEKKVKPFLYDKIRKRLFPCKLLLIEDDPKDYLVFGYLW